MKTQFVHRLVAKAFLSNPENKRTVDHINRNRTDNRVCNLKWATHSEQQLNQVREGSVAHKNIYGKKVQIQRNNKIVFNKSFPTLEEAIKARDEYLININLTTEDSTC